MVGSTLLLVAFALLPAVVALQPNAAPRNFGRRQCAARAPTIFLNAAADDSFEGSIAQFAPKRMLPQVRGQRIKIQEQLAGAVAGEDYVLAAQLRDDLAELRQKDPAVMAAQLRDDLARHIKRERYGEAALCRVLAIVGLMHSKTAHPHASHAPRESFLQSLVHIDAPIARAVGFKISKVERTAWLHPASRLNVKLRSSKVKSS